MHLEQLKSIEVYDAWTSAHDMNHYMKSSAWANLCQQRGDLPIYLGLYDQKTLIGTALILVRKQYGIRYFYLPWGPCLSIHEKQFKAFFHGLVLMAEKKRAAFIKCGMNLKKENLQVVQWMEEIGFQHKGFGYGYDGSWQNRYTLTVDLTKSLFNIHQQFSDKRKTALKQQKLYCIEVKTAQKEDLDILEAFEKELSSVKGFRPRSTAYFKKLMDAFHDDAVYVIAVCNLKRSEEQLSKELLQTKYQKDPEALEAKIRILNQIKKLRKEDGDQVAVAAALYLKSKNKAWNLYLYHRQKYRFMHGCDAIHVQMMEKFKAENISFYDFCGFSGSTDPNDPYYGLYQYKASFGSEIVEYLGEFNHNLDSKKAVRFHKTDRCLRKLRRKIHHFFYKKY